MGRRVGRVFRRVVRTPERMFRTGMRHIIPHRGGGEDYVEYESEGYAPNETGYNNDPEILKQLDELKSEYKTMTEQFRKQLELYKGMQDSYMNLEGRYRDTTNKYNDLEGKYSKLGETLTGLQGAYDKTKYDLDERTRELGNVQGDIGLLRQVNNDRGALESSMIKEELKNLGTKNNSGIDTAHVNFVNAVSNKRYNDDEDPLKRVMRGV